MTFARLLLTFWIFGGVFASTLTAHAAQEVLIRNVRIFDGVSDQLSARRDVLISGDTIKSVGESLSASPDMVVIDGNGRTLMPGLINAHAHIMLQLPVAQALTSDDYYFAYVATVAARILLDSGFTTIRDMSGNTFSLKKAIDQGLIDGPRIYPSGAMISQTAGHSDHRTSEAPSRLLDPASRSVLEKRGMVVVADGRAEVLQAARENLRRGATQIKIAVGGGISSYGDPLDVIQYTDDEISAAVAAAEAWGTYVAAHVYNSDGARRAVDLGVRSIEHANLIDRDTLQHMANNDVWLSPQVLIFQSELKGMTADQQNKQRQARAGLDSLMRNAAQMNYENIVFGEDVVTSLDGLARIGEEFALRSRWFEPAEILRQATSKAARLVALSGPRNPYGKLGVIEPGAVADVLIVEGNPLADLTIFATPDTSLRVIIKDGEIYKNSL
jgi:imidazolonepropionase-like amidohydrolase